MARSDKKKLKSVRQQIEAAFAHRQYPGDDNLVPGEGGQSADEEEQIVKCMEGKHWKDLSARFLRPHTSALYFFSPEALRFYLPAYLIASIVDPKEADIIPEGLFAILDPPGEDDAEPARFMTKWWADRMNGLTEEEKQAIKSWLQYMFDRNPGYHEPEDLSEEGIRFWGLVEDAGK